MCGRPSRLPSKRDKARPDEYAVKRTLEANYAYQTHALGRRVDLRIPDSASLAIDLWHPHRQSRFRREVKCTTMSSAPFPSPPLLFSISSLWLSWAYTFTTVAGA